MKMKVNLTLLKIVSKILILLILFVILFILSAFLYSARYWPDVYNYINANVTIKRIQTISELNITIITIDSYTTEGYSTTNDFFDSTTDFDDFTGSFDDFFDNRKRREIKIEDMNRDYIEMPRKSEIHYVFTDLDATTIVKDLVDEEKLTTRNMGDVEMFSVPRNPGTKSEKLTTQELRSQALPWLATVFLKNGSESQFDYNCDGAVLSSNVIITAARCLNPANATLADDVIVILGKRSLLTVGNNERVYRIKQIKLHDHFSSNNVAGDDLALLVTDEPIVFNEDVQIAKVGGNADAEEAATTGWAITGNLTVIKFDKEKRGVCNSGGSVANTYCETYGLDVSTCPSYGGLHLVKMDTQWLLRGIRFGNSAYKGFCIDKNVRYTDLGNYKEWIDDNVQKYQ